MTVDRTLNYPFWYFILGNYSGNFANQIENWSKADARFGFSYCVSTITQVCFHPSFWLDNQSKSGFQCVFLDLILIPPKTNGSSSFLIKRKLFQFKNYSQMVTWARNSHVVVSNILWVARNHAVRRLRTHHSTIHRCIQWVIHPNIRWVMVIIHQIFTDIPNSLRPRSFLHQHNVLLQLLWWAKHWKVSKTKKDRPRLIKPTLFYVNS